MEGQQPVKKVLLLDEQESSDDSSEGGGARLDGEFKLKINKEYAKRFAHNKAREERQRCKSAILHHSGKCAC